MSDKAEWRIFDDGDREFTGDYDVWIGTGDPDSDDEGSGGEVIAACSREHARLIAAAPDMLAAAVEACHGDTAGVEDCVMISRKAFDMLLAAKTKARGK